MGTETCQCDFCPDKNTSEKNLSNKRIIINNSSVINGVSIIYRNNIYKMDQTSKRNYNNFREIINSNFILKTIYMKNCAKKIIYQYRQYKNMNRIKNDFPNNKNNIIGMNNIRTKKISENPFSTRDNSKKDFKCDIKISSNEKNIYCDLNNQKKNKRNNDRKSYDFYYNQSCKKINDSDLNSGFDRATIKEY